MVVVVELKEVVSYGTISFYLFQKNWHFKGTK
jgi:hypothetical protein